MYVLMPIAEKTRCHRCGEELDCGLMGAKIHSPGQPRALCDACLMGPCEGLALTLASARLMRQAVAHSLVGHASDAALGLYLMTFAKWVEKDLRDCWPRRYAVATVDCEHCFLEFCTSETSESPSQLSKPQRAILRHAFYCSLRCGVLSRMETSASVRQIAKELDRLSPNNMEMVHDKLEAFYKEVDPEQLCPLAPMELVLSGIRTPMRVPFSSLGEVEGK